MILSLIPQCNRDIVHYEYWLLAFIAASAMDEVDNCHPETIAMLNKSLYKEECDNG